MRTFTIRINTESKKAKYLLGLISEISKSENDIQITEEKTELMKSFDKSFKELERVDNEELELKSAKDFLNEL